MEALTEKTAAFSARRMGRPKLNVVATTVHLPAEMLARIDALADNKKARSKFIREAIEAELERREKAKR